MKGKQAAKAKNRLANLDNEILQEIVTERDALKADRDGLKKQLADAKRDLHAQVKRMAGELAGAEMARIRTELAEARIAFAEEKEGLAFKTFQMVLPDRLSPDKFPAGMVEDLAEVFGMGPKLGELIAHWGGMHAARGAKRRTAQTVRATVSLKAQRAEERAAYGDGKVSVG